MRRALILIAAGLLGACAHAVPPPPAPAVKTEVVETTDVAPVSCVDDSFPTEAPVFADTTAALKDAAGPDQRFNLLAQGHLPREAWESALWAQVQNCRKGLKPPP